MTNTPFNIGDKITYWNTGAPAHKYHSTITAIEETTFHEYLHTSMGGKMDAEDKQWEIHYYDYRRRSFWNGMLYMLGQLAIALFGFFIIYMVVLNTGGNPDRPILFLSYMAMMFRTSIEGEKWK